MQVAILILLGALVVHGATEAVRGHIAQRRQRDADLLEQVRRRQSEAAKALARLAAASYIEGAVAVLAAADLALYPQQAPQATDLLHRIGIRPGNAIVMVAGDDGRPYRAVVRKAEVQWDERAERCALAWGVDAEEATPAGAGDGAA